MKNPEGLSISDKLLMVFELLQNGLLDKEAAIDFLNSCPEQERRKILSKEFNKELKDLIADDDE